LQVVVLIARLARLETRREEKEGQTAVPVIPGITPRRGDHPDASQPPNCGQRIARKMSWS